MIDSGILIKLWRRVVVYTERGEVGAYSWLDPYAICFTYESRHSSSKR